MQLLYRLWEILWGVGCSKAPLPAPIKRLTHVGPDCGLASEQVDGAQLVKCGLARKIRRAASVEVVGGEDQRGTVGLHVLLNLATFLQSSCSGRPQPVDHRVGWAPGSG